MTDPELSVPIDWFVQHAGNRRVNPAFKSARPRAPPLVLSRPHRTVTHADKSFERDEWKDKEDMLTC